MTPETYISTGCRMVRGKTLFRVAVKHFSGDLNQLDGTFADRMFRSEAAARRFIADWQRRQSIPLRVQGDLA